MSGTNMEDASQTPLLREDVGGVATLTFNRPKQLNSFSEQMLEAFHDALDTIEHDRAVRVVVLAANGRAFSTGHDLKQVRARPEEQYYRELFARSSQLMMRLQRLPQPVIAKVAGIATAAGCQLVATCDLAVASTEATFAVSGIKHGLFCSTPSVALSRNVSRKQAFEMLFTGEFIDADQALARGLVNRVTAPDQLDTALAELTTSICAKPRVAVETGKRMFYEQIERDPSSAYQYATNVMAENMMAADAFEGVSAFLDKRPPEFGH
ncbi:MAG: enoyl-CoA hydratase/carnithine racemase [Gammaproteobacteria bacterium]|jgi:enoyl-CoA hydratase/carnithine racemase